MISTEASGGGEKNFLGKKKKKKEERAKEREKIKCFAIHVNRALRNRK